MKFSVTVRHPDGSTTKPTPEIIEVERVGEAVHTYREYRADGWPFCPQCGEDELHSLDMPATIASIAGCYVCGWKPIRP